MATKPITWIGSSLDDLRDFPESARIRAGYQLRRIQEGLMPSAWQLSFATDIRVLLPATSSQVQ